MSMLRIISRLDIKGPNLIKSIQLEGLRVMGDPNEFALKYYLEGADELIFMDSVASLYGRNSLSDIIVKATNNIFIPITVGGGIRSVEDAATILRSGADKVALNTAAVANPDLISALARKFGSQAVVVSIDAKEISENSWEVYTDMGREKTGLNVIEWAKKAEELGAGEILLTSIDREGTRKGLNIELIEQINSVVKIPVIASGGVGKKEDIGSLLDRTKVSAVAVADILHYKRSTLPEIKQYLHESNYQVRML